MCIALKQYVKCTICICFFFLFINLYCHFPLSAGPVLALLKPGLDFDPSKPSETQLTWFLPTPLSVASFKKQLHFKREKGHTADTSLLVQTRRSFDPVSTAPFFPTTLPPPPHSLPHCPPLSPLPSPLSPFLPHSLPFLPHSPPISSSTHSCSKSR